MSRIRRLAEQLRSSGINASVVERPLWEVILSVMSPVIYGNDVKVVEYESSEYLAPMVRSDISEKMGKALETYLQEPVTKSITSKHSKLEVNNGRGHSIS